MQYEDSSASAGSGVATIGSFAWRLASGNVARAGSEGCLPGVRSSLVALYRRAGVALVAGLVSATCQASRCRRDHASLHPAIRSAEVPTVRCAVRLPGGKDGSGLLDVQYEVRGDGRVSAGCAVWVFFVANQVAVKTWACSATGGVEIHADARIARPIRGDDRPGLGAVRCLANLARAEVSWRWLLQVGGRYLCLRPT